MIHHWFNELVTVSVANEKQADPSSLKKKKKRITLAVDEGDQREVLRVGEAQFEGQQFGDVAYRHGRPQRHRPRHQTALLFVGHQNAQHARLRIRTAWVKRKNEETTRNSSVDGVWWRWASRAWFARRSLVDIDVIRLQELMNYSETGTLLQSATLLLQGCSAVAIFNVKHIACYEIVDHQGFNTGNNSWLV